MYYHRRQMRIADRDITPIPYDRWSAIREHLPVLAAVVAVGYNMRVALASVPPVLLQMMHDLGLNHAEGGLLTAIPVACMGVFAPVAARLSGRYGMGRSIAAGLLLLALATLVRGLGGTAVVYAATFGVGIALAVTGTIIMGVIKTHFSSHLTTVTGLYTSALAVGAASAASGTVPLSRALPSGWHAAIAVWTVPAVLAAIVWRVGMRTTTPAAPQEVGPAHVPLPWRSGRAWQATLSYTLYSLTFFAVLTWLAPLYEGRGWSASQAGLLLSLFNLTPVAGGLSIPPLASRSGDRRPWIIGCAAVFTATLLAVALAPGSAPWIFAALLGVSGGGLFPLLLTLPLDLAENPREVNAAAAMALGVGFTLAAVGPAAIGALRDATGSFTIPFLVLTALMTILIAIVIQVRPAGR